MTHSGSWKKPVEIFLVSLILFTSNIRAVKILPLYPAADTIRGSAWIEVLLWVLSAVLALWLMIYMGQVSQFIRAWKNKWPLILFIMLAFLSLVWSISSSATLYRSLVLLFSTFLGAYLGTRYGIRGLLDVLFWFGAILVMLCFFIPLRFPWYGTMLGSPYFGAWRGIFWHRNHMASVMSILNSVFLMRGLIGIREHNRILVIDFIFYLLSIVLVFLSRSATGYILLIILNFCVLLAWLWLKLNKYLRPWHYYVILAMGITAGVLIFLNFNFVMGLFNRSSSLTGRVPMWGYLFSHVIARKPWLGNGFGAIWTVEAFRLQVQEVVGWGYQVLIGDNGYIDILLHLGIAGLGIFFLNIVFMLVAAVKLALRRIALENFFPLVVMIYALVANISFSLFLELEAFVWMLMVAGWFATQKDLQDSPSKQEIKLDP